VVGAFLEVYGDIGLFTLVGAALLGGFSLPHRVIRRSRRAPVAGPEICARCGGTDRFISRDGLDWPCLERH
jgi:hypothetical protein